MRDWISREAKAIEQDKRVTSFAWALIMETAASFEVASYSISDADAKKSAEGAIKYARDTANKYYTTPQQPQEQGEAVAKVLFRQDEDGLEPISFYSNDEYPKEEEELKDRFVMMDVYLSPQQPQEQGELVKKAVADVLVEALSTIRHNAYMDSSTNKTVIEIYEVADKAIMAYVKLSEVKHDTK